MTGPHDSALDAPRLREDVFTWQERTDGGATVTVDLEAPAGYAEGSVEVASVTLAGGRVRLALRVRPQ